MTKTSAVLVFINEMAKLWKVLKTGGSAFALAVAFSALTVECKAESAPPLMMIRLRGPHTADDVQWAKTFKALSENRAACDEVWFSTGIGFPKMEWHEAHVKRLAKHADQLRSVGIIPSLQFQATLGHQDKVTLQEGIEGKSWGGFTGRGGLECKACNCPRQPKFLAYIREMARLYASFKPGSVWIDDDLRIAGHAPGSPWGKVPEGWIGCWCALCIESFNAETGGKWTRESLDRAMKSDSALFGKWERFSFASIAAVAKAIAEETHRISPATRLAYQHGAYRNDSQLAVYRAMHEATGMPVGARPGGGLYFDYNPNDQMVKAFGAMRQRRMLGNPSWIDAWCPEIETYPRAFASRTAQGLLNESFVNLALGMNCLSFLIMDTRYETDKWYSRNLLRPLAAERGFMEEYVRHNAGTVPAGFRDNTSVSFENLYRYALTGVPVLPGHGKPCGDIADDDIELSQDEFLVSKLSSSAIMDIRRKLDLRADGKTPVVVESPTIGLVMPRVTENGVLRSVALLNARIDVQDSVTLLLRGVAAGTKKAKWRSMRGETKWLEVEYLGKGEARVTIPEMSAWNCGWLGF